ncbi:MAG TPA: hypothetical protein VKT52_01720 [Ktedonobacterales bacterium]|nr:hypothetical protein [Ktedonobacterales bacterium]
MPDLTMNWEHLTRAAAVAGYVALALGVALGLCQSIARQRRMRGSWALADAHQLVTLLAALLVATHLGALALDPLLSFPAVAVLLPIGDPNRPIAHALGAVGLYALALVLVTSWLRRLLPYRVWRGLHGVSFVLFVCVTVHGVLAGSDSGLVWMRALYIGCAGCVAVLLLVRLALSLRGAPTNAPDVSRARG